MTLSIIIPVLDEAMIIGPTLDQLQPLRDDGVEVIVSDGGSTDGTQALVRGRCDTFLESPAGRARQMNAGALASTSDALLFLHADTRLPPDAPRLVRQALQGHVWGRFDVMIEGRSRLLPLVARLMNLRSRLTAIATGDQCIFIRRQAFVATGGFADIPIMEDVEFSARLRQIQRPAIVAVPAVTSGRRWDRNGALRTIGLMWRLRLAYARGADPRILCKLYDTASPRNIVVDGQRPTL